MGWETYRHHICTRGFIRGAFGFWRIGQHDHIVVLWRESAIPNEVIANVHGIVDAALQLVFGTKVVDSDQESFSARHRNRFDVYFLLSV